MDAGRDMGGLARPRARWIGACALLAALALGAAPRPETETRYLLFQVFTAAGNPDQAMGGTMTLKEIPDRVSLQRFARGVKERIGSTGDNRRKLGFTRGHRRLGNDDEQGF